MPVQCDTVVTPGDWHTLYEATRTNGTETLVVRHVPDHSNEYFYRTNVSVRDDVPVDDRSFRGHRLPAAELMRPFAGSDFWLADLGLEFFHWPDQKVLKHEMRRGRECAVLESTDPHPSPNGYSRVVSWIDQETLGIVQARAYDAKGRLLKEFYPKSFKKVRGQWEPQEMEIINDQTGSRTWMRFDLQP
ncbi:MAG: outer membrane lipoprotein-sorting protein [Verrucomicrobiota bacterium]|nr:outer membrane lipoprotein-sorting protein [Verrucomicrobiota bacterium]